MNYYFVDFENVRTDGIKNMTGLQAADEVLIFYSEQCKNISLDVFSNLTKMDVATSCFKVNVGTKNALDFQLASYLGYRICNGNDNSSYYIVSNDKGFDCICDFWKEQNKNVNRISFSESVNIENKVAVAPADSGSKKKKSKVNSKDLVTIDEIKKYLAKDDKPEEVLVIFNQYKTKQAICNGLAKKFKDSKRASAIYKKLKPLLKEKNKS